ncbi:membrane-associated protein, putative [Bodo saltans]|uniref:Membrane-associated protein, putative n=1 Tax=Bodo saltans TaxID=75058 RepID=A0A0S4JAK3_BODSA|nr:membrane-associated protein, putative [Bodo saltans]|eukprot:CUG88593.1 membrane-associated protein, putative [Bodo saltans]
MIVIGAVQIALMVALRPMSVRFEMACGVIVNSLTLVSLVVSLVGAGDAAEVIVNVAGILELVVIGAMLVSVAASRYVLSCETEKRATDKPPVVSTLFMVTPKTENRRSMLKMQPGLVGRRPATMVADTGGVVGSSEELHALIALVCSTRDVDGSRLAAFSS